MCPQTQRYSQWSGLVTWSQYFGQKFVFLNFFFLFKNFCEGQGGAKRCDATQCSAWGGYGRALNAAVRGLGGLPQEFFCKYKLWKRHFRAILKRKNWEKKVFALKKVKKVSREACTEHGSDTAVLCVEFQND